MKKRRLFYSIIKQLDHKNAIVITGMRQVGKTTLMRQLYDLINGPKVWFDLDNPLDQMIFEDVDFNTIFKNLSQRAGSPEERLYVFIDEIQNFPIITKVIKYLIDHCGVKFIVTGSSNFYLKNLFPESLSGRKFLYNLYPLDFKEYLYFNNLIPEDEMKKVYSLNHIKNTMYDFIKKEYEYNKFIQYGGFPEVVVTTDIETKKLILKNIFGSFFEKGLTLLSNITDIRELRNLILLLVPRAGNMLDITKLAAEININRAKVYNYLEFLQTIFFIRLIPKYSQSIDRSVAGGKKVYFSDTGLLNLIGNVNDGQLFENAVANQLVNYGELSFYNKRNTAEIDFILNKKIAFETKLNGTIRDLEKLKYLAQKLNISEYYLISKSFLDDEGMISPVNL